MKNIDFTQDYNLKDWNNDMYKKHPTPYTGIAGIIEYQRAKKIYKNIKEFNKTKATIIEIGCEQGNLLKYLSTKLPNYNFIGIDISSDALLDANKTLDNTCLLLDFDITSDDPFPLIPKPDFIICSEVLEHIPNYKKAIIKIHEIASADSIIIITVPLEKYKNLIKHALKKTRLFKLLFKDIEDNMSEWHINNFSKEAILKTLNPYFKILKYKLLLGLHQIIIVKKNTPNF